MSRPDVRRDIQGARGLGVILVVIGHLFLWPTGVFAALDIFFVLSGFLITAILAAALPKYGVKFFAAFYLSRARRLMPMALLVLAVTVVATYLIFEARGPIVLRDSLFAAFFAVNWHFAAQGTDYFATQSESPVLHYWSLSVEEQFYLVWPLLILGALTIAARRHLSTGRVLGVLLGTVVAASFGYSLWHSAADPTVSYFSTFDRVWEFGAGGLVALAAPWLGPRVSASLKSTQSWLGLIGVLGTIFLIDASVSFPAPWGLLPVGFTIMILIGGIGGETRSNWALDNPFMTWAGDLSYSIYLWHLPLIVLLEPYFAPDSPAYYVTVLLATVVVSTVSFYAVERPLRYAPFLMLPAERRRGRAKPGADATPEAAAAPAVVRRRPVLSVNTVVAGVVVVAVAVVAATTLRGNGPASAGERVSGSTYTGSDPQVIDLQDKLTTALDAAVLPDLTPSPASLTDLTWEAAHEDNDCVDVTTPEDLGGCRYGRTGRDTPTAVLVGDSMAISWVPTVRAALADEGWGLQQLTLAQCGTWTLPSYVQADGSPFPACERQQQFAGAWIAENEPDLVILASSYDQVQNAQRPDIDADPPTLAQEALGTTLERLVDVAGIDASRLLVLGSPPNHAFLADCAIRSNPGNCTSEPDPLWYDHVRGESAAADAAGATYVDVSNWFCVGARCPGFVGDDPVTYDGSHLTIGYAETLAPAFASVTREVVESAAAPPR